MSETNNNARIFQEQRDAEADKEEMRKNILLRFKDKAEEKLDAFRESPVGRAGGAAWDSQLAKSTVAGLRDAYRRVFEQGYWGKDIFDGRWHMDNRVGQTPDMLGGQYDHRQSFYGVDTNKENAIGDVEKAEEGREQQRSPDIGR